MLYTTVDRADNKQYRELYVSPEAIAVAKKGEALPSGTVITLVQFAAKLDEHPRRQFAGTADDLADRYTLLWRATSCKFEIERLLPLTAHAFTAFALNRTGSRSPLRAAFTI